MEQGGKSWRNLARNSFFRKIYRLGGRAGGGGSNEFLLSLVISSPFPFFQDEFFHRIVGRFNESLVFAGWVSLNRGGGRWRTVEQNGLEIVSKWWWINVRHYLFLVWSHSCRSELGQRVSCGHGVEYALAWFNDRWIGNYDGFDYTGR